MIIKRLFLPLGIVVFFLFCYILFMNTRQSSNPIVKEPEIYPSVTQPTKNTFEGFRLDWIEIDDIEKIELYSNLHQKLTTSQILSDGKCKYLVSAGFYTKEDNHIGLFISNNETLSNSINDDFFDGYFYITNNHPVISLSEPKTANTALQSGPVVLVNNTFLDKNYPNDSFSRRIMVGTTRKGSVVFLVIYGDNKIVGPKLSETKKIIENLESRTSLDLVSLINLDGGSHSAFLTDTISIPELSIIGGYFCILH